MLEDETLTISAPGVLFNDSDADADALTAKLISGPQHGTLNLAMDGSLVYTANANYAGTDSFIYVASDGTLDSNPVTVVLNITAVNDAPTAKDDSYSLLEDQPLLVSVPGVLSNDSDADGDVFTANLVAGPQHGTLILAQDGSLVYTPALNYSGADSFVYVANDGLVDSNLATVTLSISALNDAPVSADDSYSVDEDFVLAVDAPGLLTNDSDIDSTTITAALVAGPSNGTLALIANGSFTYTPNHNFNGTDTFTYLANDGFSDSSVATVFINVTAINDAPTAGNDSYSTKAGKALNITAPGVSRE